MSGHIPASQDRQERLKWILEKVFDEPTNGLAAGILQILKEAEAERDALQREKDELTGPR